VQCLDNLIQPGEYVRVSGGVASTTPTPTPVPTEVPTPEPTEEPTEEPTAVSKQAPGDGEPYTLCLMPNGDWTGVEQVDCSLCLATTDVVTDHGTFTEELLGPIPEPGEFDVLLLDGGCGGVLSLLAADGEGAEPAVVAAQGLYPIPSIMVPGMLILLGLLALSGAVILRRG
jgi:hypothetical protein